MPLNPNDEPVAARIFQGLHNAIRRPGCRDQFPPQRFYRLMMMAVYRCGLCPGQLSQTAVRHQPHSVRVSIPRPALLMLDGARVLADNVLNQGAAARYIQSLGAKADREHRRGEVFSFGQRQQIRSVFFRVHGSKLRVRLSARVPSRLALSGLQTPANA